VQPESIVIIRPAKRVVGSISVPGDKSISHRAAMLAAIADGTSQIRNYATSADCASTLSCLQKLGVRIERDGAQIVIHGVGAKGLSQPEGDLDCGNSGTTMRLLAGIVAGQNLATALTGDESLRSRPMQRVIEPLELMGAVVSSDNGRAPLRIQGRDALKPIDYELLVASAQVKSCILLAGLTAEGKTTVVENEITRDHTERLLRWFGAPLEVGKPKREPDQARFAAVTGPAQLRARNLTIPGDISSAAYFVGASAMLPGSTLEINDVGLNETRTALLEILAAMNFIEVSNAHEEAGEPVGTIRMSGTGAAPPLKELDAPLEIGGPQIPRLIDELPLLAVIGSQTRGGIEIRNAKELRMKESDRIATTVEALRAMGGSVEEFEDGLRVTGSTKLNGARIDSHGDHRIAMSFAIAGLVAEGETEIVGAECVAISFPEFFDLLESVVER